MIGRGGRVVCALAVSGMLVLSACSTPDADPTPPVTPSSTPTATPTPTPTPTCGSLDAEQAAAEAIELLPPPFEEPRMSDVTWDGSYATLDGYDPCATLSWIAFPIEGGTVSSPSQVALFHLGKFVGPATERAYGFWPEVERVSDSEIRVTYTWPQGNESNAEASGRSVALFEWRDGEVQQTGELPPY